MRKTQFKILVASREGDKITEGFYCFVIFYFFKKQVYKGLDVNVTKPKDLTWLDHACLTV